MRFIDTVLDAAYAVDLGRNEDERGLFARTFDANLFLCGFE
jgi:dTDP-4-dehydrorhamnose 3,5-epimerase-like enzyme